MWLCSEIPFILSPLLRRTLNSHLRQHERRRAIDPDILICRTHGDYLICSVVEHNAHDTAPVAVKLCHRLLRVRIPHVRLSFEAPRRNDVVLLAARETEYAVKMLLFSSRRIRFFGASQRVEKAVCLRKPQRTVLTTSHKHANITPILQPSHCAGGMRLKIRNFDAEGRRLGVASQVPVATVPYYIKARDGYPASLISPSNVPMIPQAE
jgi:hypothetical protein